MTRQATFVALVAAVGLVMVVAAMARLGDSPETHPVQRQRSQPDGGPGATTAATRSPPTDDPCSWDEAAQRLTRASCLPPRAPRRVMAFGRTTDDGDPQVHVSWDRNDPRAAAYEVFRDGRLHAELPVGADAWRAPRLVDSSVPAGAAVAYAVRARYRDGSASPLSAAAEVRVPAGQSSGAGRTFRVDDYVGTDIERARGAIDDAKASDGGIVQFGPRRYRFDDELLITGNDVVLRGAGRDRTVIEAGFVGAGDGCDPAPALIRFSGGREDLSDVRLERPITPNSDTLSLTSTADIAVGDVLVLDESTAGTPPTYESDGIVQDPGTGNDRRSPYETNRVEHVDDTGVKLADPVTFGFTGDAVVRRIGSTGTRNGIEHLTLQGPGPDSRSHYRLLALEYVADFSIVDVTARWANRHLVQLSGYNVSFVGFHGPEGGLDSFDGEPCKYRVSVVRSANVAFVDGVMGVPNHDRNQSFVTFQKGQRFVVRDSRFHGSRTYAVNEHGLGSKDIVVENNLFEVGPGARHGAILLGNNTWGFSGPALIRNNKFVGSKRDLYLQENSYGTRFVDNVSIDNQYRVIDGYGWAGPDTDERNWGSMRLTVARNEVRQAAGDGVFLGGERSEYYPFGGVKDVTVVGNSFDVAGRAVRLDGGGDAERVRVFGNTPPVTAD